MDVINITMGIGVIIRVGDGDILGTLREKMKVERKPKLKAMHVGQQ